MTLSTRSVWLYFYVEEITMFMDVYRIVTVCFVIQILLSHNVFNIVLSCFTTQIFPHQKYLKQTLKSGVHMLYIAFKFMSS